MLINFAKECRLTLLNDPVFFKAAQAMAASALTQDDLTEDDLKGDERIEWDLPPRRFTSSNELRNGRVAGVYRPRINCWLMKLWPRNDALGSESPA